MLELALHLLDIIENSVQAGAKYLCINIDKNYVLNQLSISVKDDGCGMDEATLQNAQDPFYTSKSTRVKKVGLGIPLFKQNAIQCNGSFEMSSELGKGTYLKATFQYDHIDRIPLGNINDTLVISILGHPEVDFSLELQTIELDNNSINFDFDTKEVREELGDIPLTYPDVISYIEETINNGIKKNKMEEL